MAAPAQQSIPDRLFWLGHLPEPAHPLLQVYCTRSVSRLCRWPLLLWESHRTVFNKPLRLETVTRDQLQIHTYRLYSLVHSSNRVNPRKDYLLFRWVMSNWIMRLLVPFLQGSESILFRYIKMFVNASKTPKRSAPIEHNVQSGSGSFYLYFASLTYPKGLNMGVQLKP